MRTFIAIELSDIIKQELSRIQSELKDADADVKWVELENIHLTLRFLGEITDQQLIQVKEALDKIAPLFNPYEIKLSGIGAFPKLDFPRVVWVGIKEGVDETKKITENIENELSKFDFQKEEHAFTPHLTIGRVSSPKNKQALKDKILTLNLKPLTINSQLVAKLNLFQSTLTPQGPIYTCLHTSQLSE